MASDHEPAETEKRNIIIEEIVPVTVEGNTNYFIKAKGEDTIYIAGIAKSNRLPFLKAGDKISIEGEAIGDGSQFNISAIED